LLRSAIAVGVSAVVVVAPLLLLGFCRSDFSWRLSLGAGAMLMALAPMGAFWIHRPRDFYPLDAVGLLILPFATPFIAMRLLRFALDRLFNLSLPRAGEAIFVVGGCAFVFIALYSLARVFFLYVRLPLSKPPV
jgi:hypothetical protein